MGGGGETCSYTRLETMSRLSPAETHKNNHHERQLFTMKHHCSNIDMQVPEVLYFFFLFFLVCSWNSLPSLIAVSLKDKKRDREKIETERQI